MQSFNHKNLVIFFILSMLSLTGFSQSPNYQLEKADSLFSHKKFTEAFNIYQELFAAEKASPAMLLRMAYIQEGLGNISKTLFYLNEYYSISSDKRVLHKMKELAEKHKLTGYEFSDYEYARGFVHKYNRLIILTLLILTGLVFLVIVYQKFRLKQKPVVSGVLFVLFAATLSFFTNFDIDASRGIVQNNTVYLMSGPSSGAKVVKVINKGHRLKILGREDIWLRVEWDDKIVFIRKSDLLEV